MAASDGPQTQLSRSSVPPERLIGGSYAVDLRHPLLGAGGGLNAYLADRRGAGPRAMAVQSHPDAPPRMQAIAALAEEAIPDLLTPLAMGPAQTVDGHEALFVVCPAPAGASLAALMARPGARAWSEQELLQGLLRPAAGALAALARNSVTHRAIRPDNLFCAGPGGPVALGCAWAAPPASLQPAIFEPPYVGMCPAAGRGEGGIADDVYALGVVMLVLALGRVPLEGMDEREILRLKIDQGSFRALVGQERLPPIVADLVSGMLAEDPEHRPPPTMLADPAVARSRRVAARPHRRAQRPLQIGGREIWHARGLAHALAGEADGGAKLLRSGAVDTWLRRALGAAALGAAIEEAARQRHAEARGEDPQADALLAMRAVVAIDPLAPLCWEGLALWPDGIGTLLASLPPDEQGVVAGKILRLIASEAAIAWAASRPERADLARLKLDMRQSRARLRGGGWTGGLRRLRFALNPLLACRSSLLADAPVLRLADLLPALETAAARTELHAQLPVDRDIGAFIAVRSDSRLDSLVAGLAGTAPGEPALSALRLLASLQTMFGPRALPRLAAWLGEHLAGPAATWRNRPRRERCAATLRDVVAAGRLDDMVALLDDPAARQADLAGARAAEEMVRRIDAELAALASGGAARAAMARRIGQEVAGAVGLAALGALAIVALAG